VKPDRYLKFGAVAFIIVIFDQVTKWYIIQNLSLHDVYQVIPGCFNLVQVHNPGSAFGLFADHHSLFRTVFLLSASVVALCLILYLHHNTPGEFATLSIGFALIFGGAIGNIIDRIRLGYVIDFIDVHIGVFHWPAFNVADSAITIGMLIFAFYMLFRKISV
jgi:signal peptidase II